MHFYLKSEIPCVWFLVNDLARFFFFFFFFEELMTLQVRSIYITLEHLIFGHFKFKGYAND